MTAAAVKLGLLAGNELDEEETGDLVELAADGVIAEPRSGFGAIYGHWEILSLVQGESLVPGSGSSSSAQVDHRVKEGLLEVAWDDDAPTGYRDPKGGRRCSSGPGAQLARPAVPPLSGPHPAGGAGRRYRRSHPHVEEGS